MRCKFVPILLAVMLLGGCAAMPYNEDFACPQMENGQCISVENAYETSLGNASASQASPLSSGEQERVASAVVSDASHTENGTEMLDDESFNKALQQYQRAVRSQSKEGIAEAKAQLQTLYSSSVEIGRHAERLEAIVTEEKTRLGFLGAYALGQRSPGVRKPATLMETYILPYQTHTGALAGERTLWIPVEEATWVWPDSFGDNKGSTLGDVK